MLISRFYIYDMIFMNIELKIGFSLYKVGKPVLSHLEIEKLIAIKNNIYKKFEELWNIWSYLCCDDWLGATNLKPLIYILWGQWSANTHRPNYNVPLIQVWENKNISFKIFYPFMFVETKLIIFDLTIIY